MAALWPDDELIAELRILSGRRADLNADRTRCISRLCGQLNGIYTALERALERVNHGSTILLSGYRTPAALRRTGGKRLET
ncbi:hypothetical protein [Streptomyces sp. YGL11-2]|uniref:hypothetical protein n=1 Tax=Streptomyces sp. YGL11-2 TaxID=3414028 RepID=UPI003CF88603